MSAARRRGSQQLDPRQAVVLVGMMGSGKSTVGRLLARRMDAAFTDLDDLIAERAGRSCADVLRAEGETSFRRLERSALRAWLDCFEGRRAVLASGGGAVLLESSRKLLRQRRCTTVWLMAAPESLAERLGRCPGAGRPLLHSTEGLADVTRRLAELLAERRSAYAEAADLSVDTSGLDPSAVVERLLASLRGGAAP